MLTKTDEIQELRDFVGECEKCNLCRHRTNIVFGDGNADARLMFVGEAPGANEDQLGVPFVGRAGKLLDKMIEAMGLKRKDVYICNIVKCRPPNNRDPKPEEVKACWQILDKQIETVNPEIICTLGRPATQTLLQTDSPIGHLRGKVWAYGPTGTILVPTYHPAYLLRNPSAKKKSWQDLKLIMERLGLK